MTHNTDMYLALKTVALSRRGLARVCSLGVLLLCLLPLTLRAADAPFEPLIRHYDNVLGTSMDLTIYGPDRIRMEAAADAALTEIARLEKILTTYNDDSELMQLNRDRSTDSASDALLDVVELCEQWYQRSDMDFSCRLAQVMDFWDRKVEEQVIPGRSDVISIAHAANASGIEIDRPSRHIALGDSISLDPSGVAKGYVIDKAMAVLRERLPDAPAIKLDIGGDAMYWGVPPGRDGWQVEVADPMKIADNAGFISGLSLNTAAVATSGHTSRTRSIRGREYSHILVPSTGWPVINGVYAVVLAPDTATADAAATALSVKNAQSGLKWVNSVDGVEALLIDSRGEQYTSDNWQGYLNLSLQRQMNTNIEMTVTYTIPDLNLGSYLRPYMAIWITDAEGNGIKNLLVLGRDERYLRDVRRWWREIGSKGVLDINTTRPSRRPGEYTLVWDGRDDYDVVVPLGDYVLNLEANREKGGYSYQRIPFSTAEGRQQFHVDGKDELGDTFVTLDIKLPQD